MTSKILVIGDDPHAVHKIEVDLSKKGYKVIPVFNSADSLKLTIEHKPDLIVIGTSIPTTTALKLIEEIWQHEKPKNTPVIILTEEPFAIRCLIKPFNLQELKNIDDIIHN